MNLVPSVISSNYGVVTSSRIIAKGLRKRHSDVLRDLDNILNSKQDMVKSTNANLRSLIILSNYKDLKGELRKQYLLPKDGFILYMFNIQGYLDFKLAYIQKFNEMEAQLQQQKLGQLEFMDMGIDNSMIHCERLLSMLKIHTDTCIETLEKLKYEQGYIKEYLIYVEQKKKENLPSVTVTEFAKQFKGISYVKLYDYFRNNGYIYKNSREPSKKALNDGLFIIENNMQSTADKMLITRTPKITAKGQEYFKNILNKEFEIDVSEELKDSIKKLKLEKEKGVEVDVNKELIEEIEKLGLNKDEIIEKAVKKVVKKKKKKK